MMSNPMTGSPLALLMNAMRQGKNPTAVLNQMAMGNPQVQQAMRMMQGKSPAQLRQIAENMAAERGISINDIARQLGINLPSDK